MNIIENAVCPGCTLLCDDVTYEIDGQKFQSNIQCAMAQKWIDWANAAPEASNQSMDDVQAAISHLVACLNQSKLPLIAGLGNLTLQGQQAAWKIADAAGAVLDKSIRHRGQGSLYALQRQGKVSASLGEVANRSDLLIFWFCDPVQTHPRMLEKLKASNNKTVVVVDSKKTETSKLADHVVIIEERETVEFLSAIRRLLSGGESETVSAENKIRDEAIRLVKFVTSCRYGCFLYGHCPTGSADDPVTLSHQKLVRRLNDHTRMVSIGLRTDENGRSAENVMAAFSGYPVSVSQAKGIPEYCGDIWSASRLLERGQCDFLLLFTGRNWERELASMNSTAKANLAALSKVVIHSGTRPDSDVLNNALMLQVAIAGASGSGDFSRFDDALLPLAPLVDSNLPTDAELLSRVFDVLTGR